MRPRSIALAGTGVFGKQSPGPALCDPLALGRQAPSRYRGAPSPEVTGPSCRVPWRGFSRPPRYALPAHLCRFAVRSPPDSLEDFLGGSGSARSVRRGRLPSPSPLRSNAPADLPAGTPYGLGGPRRGPRAYPPASLRRSNTWRRDGNLNPLSIACAFRPRLRPASPAADQPGCGTLGHPVGGIRTLLALLMPTFALPAAPGRLPPPLHGGGGRSPTMILRRWQNHPRLRRRA